MKLLICLVLCSVSAFARDLDKRPPAFAFGGGLAVFTDFQEAHYAITYDIPQKKAYAVATIRFQTAEAGFPIFDSQAEPVEIRINNSPTSTTLTSTPDMKTKVRVINSPVAPGIHTMQMALPINQLVEFSAGSVKSAFWMTDLTDRGYLERYLPTNLLFDRIPMTFHVKFIGLKEMQNIYANGSMVMKNRNEVIIRFPAGLNASCLYFHTTPASQVAELRFSFRSVDGREVPSVVYLGKNDAHKLNDLKNKVLTIISELEADYGAFPHPTLTVYLAGSGGMEYSGATMTSSSALGHELFHSYFARGVMPSDGNSGWIDEALASWRDGGYASRTTLSGSSNMANMGTYNRVTDTKAYTFGASFMAYLDGKLKAKGGLKPFLRHTLEKKLFEPINVAEFVQMMNDFYGLTLTPEFRRYVFGESFNQVFPKEKLHPIHQQLTIEELQKLL